jgi:ribosome assembly protein YihI (activator of Der GTPase)
MSLGRDILGRAQAYVDRKYVARSDERQRAMGLAYVEAEKDDLAREFARFAVDEINRYARMETKP